MTCEEINFCVSLIVETAPTPILLPHATNLAEMIVFLIF